MKCFRRKLWPGFFAGLFALIGVTLVAGAQQAAPARPFRLVANDAAFWSLIGHKAQLTRMGTGFGFTEGPVWDKSGYLWVSDEILNKIYRLYPDGHRDEVISLGDPDGNTYDRNHALIDCASVLRAIIRLSPDGRATRSLLTTIRESDSTARTTWSSGRMERSISQTRHLICRRAKPRRFHFRESIGWIERGAYNC